MAIAWWKRSVVYHIYPRSFCDSDGDGVGDLPGITSRLDYLQQLGVDVVWLGPVYDSPNDDNGYDIRDYRTIAAEFGTMQDWEAMLAGMHERGIRLIMDLVINHTSDEHPWFRASRGARDGPLRDRYIWRPPAPGGGPPNNWASFFGGSAWDFDEVSGEYYLHLFSRRQPDLNWEDPATREAIHEMVRWWLDKGIDGFRLDAINLISKPLGLPDAPVVAAAPHQVPTNAFNGPRLLEFLRELRDRSMAGRDVLTVGETARITPEIGLELSHEETGGLGMVHPFEHTELDKDEASSAPRWIGKRLELVAFKRVLSRWQDGLGEHGWMGTFLSNHDLPRPVSRFGDDRAYRRESATLLATLVHGLRGTPFVYQGDEIGMTNVSHPSIDDYRDVETRRMYREFVEERGLDAAVVMGMIHARSRDNARTPMQWDAGPQAGFTTGSPWMPLNPNYDTINVAAEIDDPDSILNYHRALIALRRERPALIHGRYRLLLPEHETIYAFVREADDERLLVLLNLTSDPSCFVPPAGIEAAGAARLLGNYREAAALGAGEVTLRPWEARIDALPPDGVARASGRRG